MGDRTGRLVVFADHTDKFIVENESRSFLHRVNDQVRKRQNQSSKDATKDSDKHSVIWGMFMSSTLQASLIMVKKSDSLHSIKNTGDLTTKQMFDISEKLISEQDEIYGVKTITWEDSSWKYLSLICVEQIFSLQRTKVYVFSDSVLCLGKIHETTQSNTAWEQRLESLKSSPEYRALDKIDGEPMEFEWNIFPGFTTLQLVREVQELLSRMSVQPEQFKDELSSCRCSTTSHGDLKTMKKNANQGLPSFLSMRKDFHQDNGHSSYLDQKRSGILLTNTIHKENGTELRS